MRPSENLDIPQSPGLNGEIKRPRMRMQTCKSYPLQAQNQSKSLINGRSSKSPAQFYSAVAV
ncbi:hypothetical protein PAAG_12373 [Paracoccidioides lutzii Pb01]|uniref:Uncharacterized protein n=1 Tax=Paracoccidioides lutzii (strain ATCC MYA-826 / Pb01) TaxID=502779 RepID=A0A0A2UZD5_PARBA|nr:hypothetical protein PAAG_12373 [Paracoccidioides lutzii Pb01]KGQ00946.1 hypothetical protein PAAG_12373 [Paracoccidioides lutzii Pb01]